jgi:hypothetical protein
MLARKLNPASDEEQHEVIAVIVRSAVTAISEGGVIGVSPGELIENENSLIENKETKKTDNKSNSSINAEKKGPKLLLCGAYVFNVYSEENYLKSGFQLSFGAALKKEISLLINVGIRQHLEKSSESLNINVLPFPLGVTLKKDFIFSRFSIGPSITMETIIQKYSSRSLNELGVADAGGARLETAAVPGLDMGFILTDNFIFFISLSAEIMIHKVDYTIMDSGNERTILEGWRIRPLAIMGIKIASF